MSRTSMKAPESWKSLCFKAFWSFTKIFCTWLTQSDNLGRIVIPKENRRPGGFSKYVTQQISMMSNMRTYTENFGNIEKRNALYAQLSSKPESVHTHMVAIDCTWSQRAYSASIYGFYCGYHGAMCIIDEVMPLPFSSAMNTRKTVAMTSRFGFVRSAGYSM